MSPLLFSPNSGTFPAISIRLAARILSNIGIFLCVLVSMRAMSLCEISGRTHTWSKTSANIFRPRNWLKVFGVYTRPNATEMIQIKTFWNWPDKIFIRKSMGMFMLLLREHYLAVSRWINRSRPQPTAGVRLRGTEFQKTINRWYSFSSHVIPFNRIGQGCASLNKTLRPVLNYTLNARLLPGSESQ